MDRRTDTETSFPHNLKVSYMILLSFLFYLGNHHPFSLFYLVLLSNLYWAYINLPKNQSVWVLIIFKGLALQFFSIYVKSDQTCETGKESSIDFFLLSPTEK